MKDNKAVFLFFYFILVKVIKVAEIDKLCAALPAYLTIAALLKITSRADYCVLIGLGIGRLCGLCGKFIGSAVIT